MTRPSKHEYYIGIAEAVAKRSTCLRRQYGAVIVKDDRIISTGYNGSARGLENCCDKGVCWREEHDIPHGQQYEKCQAVHAEANAIINANPTDMIGATLYLAGFENGRPMSFPEPCEMCSRLIINAQIGKVVTREGSKWFDVRHIGGIENQIAIAFKNGLHEPNPDMVAAMKKAVNKKFGTEELSK